MKMVKVPRLGNVHPLVRLMVHEMQRQKIGWKALSERTGYHENTLKGWAGRHNNGVWDARSPKPYRSPATEDLMTVLSTLGLELWPVRVNGPPLQKGEIDPIATYNYEIMRFQKGELSND